MRKRYLAAALAVSLVAVGCSNRDEKSSSTAAPATAGATVTTAAPATTSGGTTATSTGSSTSPTTAGPTTTAAPAKPMFGTMESPCGPAGPAGVPKIADGQNGGEVLKLATATDHGSDLQPGLTVEMLDAAQAFAAWCNDQGGIRGLTIQVDDADGKLFSAPAAMETVCANDFAMVGGGWVFDDQIFPRFNECKMINFASYTVTPTAAVSSGMVQPIPNPPNTKPASWFLWAKNAHPNAIQRTALLFSDFLTTQVVKDEIKATFDKLGGFSVVDEIPLNPGGEANWVPIAQKLKDDNIQFFTITGTDTQAIGLAKALKEINYQPELALFEANFYTDAMVAQGNSDATQGFTVRTAYAPFSEPDKFPGMKSYLDMMAKYKPDGRIAGLGLQATSAYLMFVTAANTCLDANNNVLERECVLAAGKKITSWDGGGLHAPTDPASNKPPKCTIIMQVQGSEWKRLFPEFGSADDNGKGWHCDGDQGIADIEGNFGDTSKGVDPSRP